MSLDMRALGDIRDGLIAELMRIESHLPSSVVDPVISALLPHFTGAEITALVEAAAKRQMCVAILDAARSVLSVLEEGEGDLLGTVADEVDSLGELAHFGVAGGSLQLRGSARTACHVADRFLQAVVERLHESSSSVGDGRGTEPRMVGTSDPTEGDAR